MNQQRHEVHEGARICEYPDCGYYELGFEGRGKIVGNECPLDQLNTCPILRKRGGLGDDCPHWQRAKFHRKPKEPSTT